MTREENLQWWREAKLGLFIHWGIYSILGEGEWAMYRRRMPVKEYEKLAAQFNPTEFNAEEWVRFAKDNGMKYIVITAKHHDGFSMFRTKVSDYNIVDATPFGRDPLEELAKVCRKEGIRLGFYYSHVREWHHPMANSFEKKGRPDEYGNYGNFWDYPDESKKDLQTYIDEFDIPQLKELLSQYGDVLTIWFDTPSQITPLQAEKISKAVYEAQDGCLINSRISGNIESDYLSMGDDGIPAAGVDVPWETPMTTAVDWGYVKDTYYRSGSEIIQKIAETASKGGNLLINIGPDSTGKIAEGSIREFSIVGKWLKENGEAIYGTKAAGFPYQPKWGFITKKDKELYLIVTYPGVKRICLTGLMSKVKCCRGLTEDKSLQYCQKGDSLSVDINDLQGEIRVIRVTCQDEVLVRTGIYNGDDSSITLPVSLAEARIEYPYSKMRVRYGVTENWFNEQDSVSWNFENTEEGIYRLQLLWDSKSFWGLEDFGHELQIELDGNIYDCIVQEDVEITDGVRPMEAGTVELKSGSHRVRVKPGKIIMTQLIGLRIRGVRLEKIK